MFKDGHKTHYMYTSRWTTVQLQYIQTTHTRIVHAYFAYTRISICAYIHAYMSLLCIPISLFIWSIVGQKRHYFLVMKKANLISRVSHLTTHWGEWGETLVWSEHVFQNLEDFNWIVEGRGTLVGILSILSLQERGISCHQNKPGTAVIFCQRRGKFIHHLIVEMGYSRKNPHTPWWMGSFFNLLSGFPEAQDPPPAWISRK